MRVRLLVSIAAVVALGATPALAAKEPETDSSLSPEAGAGHYIGGQSESGVWHGCKKEDISWFPRSLVSGQQTLTKSTSRYVSFKVNTAAYPTFTWKAKAGYRICGAEAFAALGGAGTQGGQLLSWVSYKSGPTSGTTATDGKETVKVHMPKDLGSEDQPDLKVYEGKTLGLEGFQAIAVYVKKK